MKSIKLICLTALTALLLTPTCAMAKTHFNFSINLFDFFPRPVIVAPAPVVVVPAPVVVAPPAPPVYVPYYPVPYHYPRGIIRKHHRFYHRAAPKIN